MHQVKPEPSNTQLNNSWRWGLLLLITIGSMVLTLSQPPIAQDPAYHLFADSRSVFGIPNTFNVLSNLPFLVVGIRAIRLCRGPQVKSQRSAWLIFFSAATLISIGSAVYHWSPTDSSLAWDRLPMAISFMSLLIAILGEYISKRLANIFLAPAILLGISSILYWRLSGDLRLYAWVQFFPLLFLPLLLLLFNSRTRRHGLLLAAVTCYLLAKLSELFDSELFNLTRNVISGHSLKHLLAAAGLYALVMRLKQKKGHNDSQTWPPWQTKRKFF